MIDAAAETAKGTRGLTDNCEAMRQRGYARMMAIHCWLLSREYAGATTDEIAQAVGLRCRNFTGEVLGELRAAGAVCPTWPKHQSKRWYAAEFAPRKEVQPRQPVQRQEAGEQEDEWDYPVKRLVAAGSWWVDRRSLAPNSVFAWARAA